MKTAEQSSAVIKGAAVGPGSVPRLRFMVLMTISSSAGIRLLIVDPGDSRESPCEACLAPRVRLLCSARFLTSVRIDAATSIGVCSAGREGGALGLTCDEPSRTTGDVKRRKAR